MERSGGGDDRRGSSDHHPCLDLPTTLMRAPSPSRLSTVAKKRQRRLSKRVRDGGHWDPGQDDSIALIRYRGPMPKIGRRGLQLWEEKKRRSHASTSSSSSSSSSTSRSPSRSRSSSKDSSSLESDSKKKKRKKRWTKLKVLVERRKERELEEKKLKEEMLKKEEEKKRSKIRKKVKRGKKDNGDRCSTLTKKYITTSIKSRSKEKVAAEQANSWVKGAGSKDTEYTEEDTNELSKDLKPMTKEEWEKSRSVIRPLGVVSPTTWRTRRRNRRSEGSMSSIPYIRSISRNRQKINRVATFTDGNRFRTTVRCSTQSQSLCTNEESPEVNLQQQIYSYDDNGITNVTSVSIANTNSNRKV